MGDSLSVHQLPDIWINAQYIVSIALQHTRQEVLVWASGDGTHWVSAARRAGFEDTIEQQLLQLFDKLVRYSRLTIVLLQRTAITTAIPLVTCGGHLGRWHSYGLHWFIFPCTSQCDQRLASSVLAGGLGALGARGLPVG